jgi:hypothetical protein
MEMLGVIVARCPTFAVFFAAKVGSRRRTGDGNCRLHRYSHSIAQNARLNGPPAR